jgi:hypothetical protein
MWLHKDFFDVKRFELAQTDHLDTLIFNICTRMGLQDLSVDSKFRKRVGINYSTTRLETLPNEWYAFIKVISDNRSDIRKMRKVNVYWDIPFD